MNCDTCGNPVDGGECLTCSYQLLRRRERVWLRSLTLVEQVMFSLGGHPAAGWSRELSDVTAVELLATLA